MNTERAKGLRANSTQAERTMWRVLHTFRTGGYHFRKQVPTGPYFADMACHHARLVIEVDGDTHYTETGIIHDRRRDRFLRGEGDTVLRFTNADVTDNPDGVFQVAAAALEGRPRNQRKRHPLPTPPRKGEGGPTEISNKIDPHP